MTSIYGPLIGEDLVRDQVRDHLQTWTPAYVAEIARQRGLDPADLPAFKSFEIRSSDQDLQAYVQLPSAAVLCTNTQVLRRRAGTITNRYRVAVVIFAGGHDHESTSQAVGRYATAVIAAIEQHPDLDGFAQRAAYVETAWDRVAPTERYEAWDGGAAVFFDVDVADAIDADAGPTALPDPIDAELVEPPPTSEILVTVNPQE